MPDQHSTLQSGVQDGMNAKQRIQPGRAPQRAATTPSLPVGAGGSYAAQVRDDSSRSRSAKLHNSHSKTASSKPTMDARHASSAQINEVTLEEQNIEEELRRLSATSRGRRGGADSASPERRSDSNRISPHRQQQQQQYRPGRSENGSAAGSEHMSQHGGASRFSSGRHSAPSGNRQHQGNGTGKHIASTAGLDSRTSPGVATVARKRGPSARQVGASTSGTAAAGNASPAVATPGAVVPPGERRAVAAAGRAGLPRSTGNNNTVFKRNAPVTSGNGMANSLDKSLAGVVKSGATKSPAGKLSASRGTSGIKVSNRAGKQKAITAVW